MPAYDVKDVSLADAGIKRIEWASREMPVLRSIKERFEREQPLRGQTLACCLHVTTETANLLLTLQAGGADVSVCASNPSEHAGRGRGGPGDGLRHPDPRDQGRGQRDLLPPHLLGARHQADDHGRRRGRPRGGGHQSRTELLGTIVAGMEETTTGIIRLKSMAADGALKYPIIAVNDADTKHFFDNRYGTGQSTIDGVTRATNVLWAGKNVVVIGYGWCGRGVCLAGEGPGEPGHRHRGERGPGPWKRPWTASR